MRPKRSARYWTGAMALSIDESRLRDVWMIVSTRSRGLRLPESVKSVDGLIPKEDN